MAATKLPLVLSVAVLAAALSTSALRADDSLPPPPSADGSQSLDAGTLPPPPGADASAAPSSDSSSALPPPPSDSSSALPPPPSSGDNSSSALPPPPSSGDNGSSALPPPPSSGDNGSSALPPPPSSGDNGSSTLPPPPGAGAAAAPSDSGAALPPPPGAGSGNGGSLPPPPVDTTAPASTSGSGSGKPTHYRVHRGDSLWRIAGKRKIYANSFEWPLLFIANRDQLQDPDLINPGQVLKVRRDNGSDAVSEAIQKAKDTPRFAPHTGPREKLPIDY